MRIDQNGKRPQKMPKLIFKAEIMGKPQPKQRPRFTRRGFAYTPKKTRDAEAEIVAQLKTKLCGTTAPPQNGLIVELEFYFTPPKSWPKAKRAAAIDGELMHTKKPDVDNLLKLFIDAATKTGSLWRDDCQIYQKTGVKRYGSKDKTIFRVYAPQ